jgi:cell wall-associated NlpC family hydrolase
MDRRLTPATLRIAHSSLKGVVDVPVYTDGTPMRVAQPVADLLRAPAGARERQLYCGWLPDAALSRGPAPTHWIASPGTHLYPEPKVQAPEICALSLGAQLAVTALHGKWAETSSGFVPACHLLPLGTHLTDPVSVAESMAGAPYLWGGNSRAGIDCSGLAQVAHLACGISCAGDSDLQKIIGQEIAADAVLRRGDLLFWKGHVALIVDADRLIHANGHSMSVAYENTEACIARILAQEGRGVTHRRRLA